TMVAFAGNSVLTRLALATDDYDAATFAAVRLGAGAMTLVALLVWRNRSAVALTRSLRPDPWATGALLLYLFGFSWAYQALDAGIGALILFGVVQLTMFTAGLGTGAGPGTRGWIGAGLAMGGLAWLVWPSDTVALSPLHALAMATAGMGWGIYSLRGRHSTDPLAATGANFVWAVPLGIALALSMAQSGPFATSAGFGLALLSGAVTSGMGYALWYRVLPQIPASTAALAQLSVPAIAMLGGMVFLSEPLTTRFVLASALILGGIAIGIHRPRT
ncbi:MAG: DMT family transporter, partial [Primorskyibacter sp.]